MTLHERLQAKRDSLALELSTIPDTFATDFDPRMYDQCVKMWNTLQALLLPVVSAAEEVEAVSLKLPIDFDGYDSALTKYRAAVAKLKAELGGG